MWAPVVLALALVMPATAPAAKSCRASTSNGAKIVTRTKSAVVFTKRGNVYGCLYRVGRIRRLLDEGGGIKEVGLSAPRLAGRYVAYATFGSAIGDEFDRVVVFDLRRGRVKHEVGSTYVQSIVVKKNGSAAWIQESVVRSANPDTPLYEVYELSDVDRQGALLLDRGRAVNPQSLKLGDDSKSVSWRNGQETRNAPLR